MKKNLLRLAAFALILAVVLSGVDQVFRIYTDEWDNFYDLPRDSLDVIILGSSHAYASFDPAVLWRERGIASYVLATPSQTIPLTYFNLKEVLKTQRPSLVILEAYKCISAGMPKGELIPRTQMNCFGMRPSKNKIDAVLAYVPQERFLELMIGPLTYHNRYQSLTREDFLPSQAIEGQKGYAYLAGSKSFDPPSSSDPFPLEALPIPEETERYYRKIIELCQSSDIPILIVVAPYRLRKGDAERYLTVEKIASEYGAAFLNANYIYGELNLDFSTDLYDAGHLSFWGGEKFSKYIADYLNDQYSLPDHRGNPKYVSWEANAEYLNHTMKHLQLQQASSLYDYIQLLSSPNDFVVIASSLGNNRSDQGIDLLTSLASCGINIPGNGIVICQNGDTLHRTGEAFDQLHMELGSYDLSTTYDFARQKVSIIINQKEKQKIANGLTLVVYDPYTDTIVDAVGFDAANGYTAVR